MDLFEKMLSEADYGKQLFESCIEKNTTDDLHNTAVLLFPDGDSETLRVAYENIDAFMEYYNTAIVIASIDISDVLKYTNKTISIIPVSEADMRCILRYTYMVRNSSTKIISLQMPYNQKADTLVGFKDISLNKIMVRSMYEIVHNNSN